MPDIFVPSDSTRYTPYLSDVLRKRLISMFTFKYCKEHRGDLYKFKTYREVVDYMKNSDAVEQFIRFAKEKGIELPAEQAAQSRAMLVEPLNANIIYNILGMLEHVKYINLTDETVLKAIEVLENGKAFPSVTAENSSERKE